MEEDEKLFGEVVESSELEGDRYFEEEGLVDVMDIGLCCRNIYCTDRSDYDMGEELDLVV